MSFVFRLVLDGYDREFLFSYLHSLVFWPSPPWISIVYWTLHVEVGFYALVLAILAFGSSRRHLLPVALLICVWSTIYNWSPGTFEQIPSWIRQVTLAELGCFFSLGIFIYFSTQTQRLHPMIVAILIALSLPACALEVASYASRERSSVAGAEIWFLALAAMMMLSVWYDKLLWRVAGGFSAQIRIMGLITYPLYLIHYSLIEFAERLLPIELKLSRIVGAAVALIASFVIAVHFEPLVRRPIRALASTLALRLAARAAYCRSHAE
jgi:peptidoglycan/LPS O-acetylase OafA/YrhL